MIVYTITVILYSYDGHIDRLIGTVETDTEKSYSQLYNGLDKKTEMQKFFKLTIVQHTLT